MLRGTDVNRKIRVVVTKMGLDAHDRGVRFIAKSLQNAGMDVIYLGLFNTPEAVANVAVQESADVIAVSSLSQEHRTHVPALMKALEKADAKEIHVIVGGLVLGEDEKYLRKWGIKGIYGPAASINEVIKDIREMVRV